MDPIALAFYAVICGLLSLFAPSLGGTVPRMLIGAVVGILAASLLPFVKTLIGG